MKTSKYRTEQDIWGAARARREAEIDAEAAREGKMMRADRRPQNIRTVLTCTEASR